MIPRLVRSPPPQKIAAMPLRHLPGRTAASFPRLCCMGCRSTACRRAPRRSRFPNILRGLLISAAAESLRPAKRKRPAVQLFPSPFRVVDVDFAKRAAGPLTGGFRKMPASRITHHRSSQRARIIWHVAALPDRLGIAEIARNSAAHRHFRSVGHRLRASDFLRMRGHMFRTCADRPSLALAELAHRHDALPATTASGLNVFPPRSIRRRAQQVVHLFQLLIRQALPAHRDDGANSIRRLRGDHIFLDHERLGGKVKSLPAACAMT
jgi:hypothetical protein